MDGGPTTSAPVSIGPGTGARTAQWAAVALFIALLFNAAWIGFLLWLVIRTAQVMVAQL